MYKVRKDFSETKWILYIYIYIARGLIFENCESVPSLQASCFALSITCPVHISKWSYKNLRNNFAENKAHLYILLRIKLPNPL